VRDGVPFGVKDVDRDGAIIEGETDGEGEDDKGDPPGDMVPINRREGVYIEDSVREAGWDEKAKAVIEAPIERLNTDEMEGWGKDERVIEGEGEAEIVERANRVRTLVGV